MHYIIHFDLVSALILLTVIVANHSIAKPKSLYSKIYTQMAVFVEICCVFDITSSLLLMNPQYWDAFRIILYISTLGYYIMQMLPVAWITLYFYAYIKRDTLNARDVYIVCIPLIIGELITLTNPFTGCMFTIKDNYFERGPLLVILYVIVGVYMVWGTLIIIKNWKKLDSAIRLVYFSYIVLSIISLTIQFTMPSYLVECTTMTILILIIHYSVQNTTMLEEAVKKEREIAEVADRINVMKSKFIFEMSHEIRTPMNAIIGMSAMAKEEIEDKEQAVSYLDTVLTSAQHLMALINNIIEMNDIVNGKIKLEPKPVIMKNEIHTIAAMMRPLFEEKEQTLQVIYNGEDEYYTMADVLRIDQVMIKILTNASSYMEKGRKAVFEVHFEEMDDGRLMYYFDVVDEGVGMSSDFIERIGEPFERERTSTESGISGVGLGLAVVKKLLTAMDADMDIESVPDKGTRFCLRFVFEKGARINSQVSAGDASADLSTQADSSNNGKEKPAVNGITVVNGTTDKKFDKNGQFMKGMLSLVVEDNEVNAKILSRALRRSGSAVLVAVNGAEAIEKVNKIGLERIGVIFMDLQMPVMDGFEATKAIRDMEKGNIDQHVPIYAVTANTATEDCNRAFEAGVDGIFAKPVHFEEFFEKLSFDGVISDGR